MNGFSVAVNTIPSFLKLYLQICPSLDLNYRCLPRSGGWLDQDYEIVFWFNIIEDRIKDIMKRKLQENKNAHKY